MLTVELEAGQKFEDSMKAHEVFVGLIVMRNVASVGCDRNLFNSAFILYASEFYQVEHLIQGFFFTWITE